MPDLLITERYLKENGYIHDNADMKIITPTIVLVQRKYILPILGTRLYESVMAEVAAETFTDPTEDLLDNYILPCMCWYVLHEATPAFQFKYLNKGIMTRSGEDLQPAGLDGIKFTMDRWKNNAEMYAQDATRFLKENEETYPLYCANTECDEIKPNDNNYTTSIYLD